MKPESLHALLIDRELGELSPDSVELLNAWLADHPENLPAIASLRQTLATAKETVRRFPELARPERTKYPKFLSAAHQFGLLMRQLAASGDI